MTNKKEFTCLVGNTLTRFANADGYIWLWGPGHKVGAEDVDGEHAPFDGVDLRAASLAVEHLSPPLSEMVKVNSNYLRRAISAIETKGNNPIYLDVQQKRLIFAYEGEDGLYRASVACMSNDATQSHTE